MCWFSQTAQNSLQTPRRSGFFGVCVLSAADPPVLQLILIPLFDGPRFDSLLPVSVKAELNVNQAARLGGT